MTTFHNKYFLPFCLMLQTPAVWRMPPTSRICRRSLSVPWRTTFGLSIPINQLGLENSFWGCLRWGPFQLRSSNSCSSWDSSERLLSRPSSETCCWVEARSVGHICNSLRVGRLENEQISAVYRSDCCQRILYVISIRIDFYCSCCEQNAVDFAHLSRKVYL